MAEMVVMVPAEEELSLGSVNVGVAQVAVAMVVAVAMLAMAVRVELVVLEELWKFTLWIPTSVRFFPQARLLT